MKHERGNANEVYPARAPSRVGSPSLLFFASLLVTHWEPPRAFGVQYFIHCGNILYVQVNRSNRPLSLYLHLIYLLLRARGCGRVLSRVPYGALQPTCPEAAVLSILEHARVTFSKWHMRNGFLLNSA